MKSGKEYETNFNDCDNMIHVRRWLNGLDPKNSKEITDMDRAKFINISDYRIINRSEIEEIILIEENNEQME